jgi:transcriptional regulator with XRE-family HTH domain
MPGKKKNHEKNLTAQQEAAINLLATGSTLEEVAEALNISITQLYRWRKGNPAFLAKLKELKVDLNLKI